MGNGPIRQFRDGAVKLVAWANERGWSWQITKSYKDKNTDEWKDSKYWFMSDLKKLKDLLQEAIDGGEDEDQGKLALEPRRETISFDDDDIPF